jgi:DNA-binding transcriptional LysR family regulator
MKREQLADLAAFAEVARERSFTRAARKLAMTQSSLSHAIRRIETQLNLRLLARTTRSVAPTDAGERLLRTLGPALEHVNAELEALTQLRERPAGTIRITAAEHSAITVLMPAVERLLPQYPDIKVEVTCDYGLTDVVAGRFDAGIRLGEQVARDMIAVRIGPDRRMAAVGSPAYFATHKPPLVPQDLAGHQCINLWLPTAGTYYAWEFEKGARELRVRVDGQLAFNSLPLCLHAVRAGFGVAFLPEELIQPDVASGALVHVLADWCAPFSGYHLYYPSRRQMTPAFELFVEALRYRDGSGKSPGRPVRRRPAPSKAD